MTSRTLVLTVALGLAIAADASAQGRARGRSPIRLQEMDRNHDGIITRSEWTGTPASFKKHDWNNDGRIAGDELRFDREGQPLPEDRDYAFDNWTIGEFRSLDRNRDNRLTAGEWRFDRQSFSRADRNRDGVLSRAEFLAEDKRNDDNGIAETGAYRAGYDRGEIEGRAAGREDRVRNQYWDLDGQRELETADSGYEARFGARSEYQAGYRDAFRRAYTESWNNPNRQE